MSYSSRVILKVCFDTGFNLENGFPIVKYDIPTKHANIKNINPHFKELDTPYPKLLISEDLAIYININKKYIYYFNKL